MITLKTGVVTQIDEKEGVQRINVHYKDVCSRVISGIIVDPTPITF